MAQDLNELTERLLQAVARVSQRHWCPATGGNFSARSSDQLLMTRSGCDKNQLSRDDLLLCDLQARALEPQCKPSDEARLHARLYQLDPQIQSVLHSHSVTATVLSRQRSANALRIQGFEMQKSLSGEMNPDDPVILPILDNNQNIEELADELERRWRGGQVLCPGLLVRGHGLYAWGSSIEHALRHLEGLEFLLECLWQERLLHGASE